jgi:hypothetical protein
MNTIAVASVVNRAGTAIPPITTYETPSLLSAARKSAKSLVIVDSPRDPEREGGIEQRHERLHALGRRGRQRVVHVLVGEPVLALPETVASLACHAHPHIVPAETAVRW